MQLPRHFARITDPHRHGFGMANHNRPHRHNREAFIRPIFMASGVFQDRARLRPCEHQDGMGLRHIFNANAIGQMLHEPIAIMPFRRCRRAIPNLIIIKPCKRGFAQDIALFCQKVTQADFAIFGHPSCDQVIHRINNAFTFQFETAEPRHFHQAYAIGNSIYFSLDHRFTIRVKPVARFIMETFRWEAQGSLPAIHHPEFSPHFLQHRIKRGGARQPTRGAVFMGFVIMKFHLIIFD